MNSLSRIRNISPFVDLETMVADSQQIVPESGAGTSPASLSLSHVKDKGRSCGLSFGKSMDDIFEKLQDDTSSLWQSPAESVKRLKQVPSAATFFKEYVATSTPVIIAGGASAWKATSSWDLDSLARENPELEVTVDWTPNGRGDCVVEDDEPECPVFVKPEERKMHFKSFVDALHAQGAQSRTDGRITGGDVCSEDDGVLYLSHQV